jgi:hypothetical protein
MVCSAGTITIASPPLPNNVTELRSKKGIPMTENDMDFKTQVIAETDNLHYQIWKADEPDGETTFHLELNNVTIHFFTEEWEEFLQLVRLLGKK